MRRIGLVVAMPEESDRIFHRLGKEKIKEKICGYEITTYNIDDKDIYLIDSGIGEINSAVAAMLLISRFKVEILINFGIVGALKEDIIVGDLLIAKDIVHYDFDVSAILPVEQGKYLDYPTVEILCDNKLIELADKANGTPLRKVRIASADKFVGTMKAKSDLINKFNADICEMESAGIIRTSIKTGVPALFIKTVSDNADEHAEDSMRNLVKNGITAYGELIEKLLKLL